MNHITLWLLVVAVFIASGCGTADRGEQCGDNAHRSVECADGLQCVWQDSIQKQVCAAPGDEGAQCGGDDDCKAGIFFCFGNTCSTQREENQLCVEDRQCKGALVCGKRTPNFGGKCLPKQESDVATQCFQQCMDDLHETCLAECREAHDDTADEGCDDACKPVENSKQWDRNTSLCRGKCW